MSNVLERLFKALEEIVNDSRPWKEKKADILQNIDEHDKTLLGEFIGWFEESDLE